MMLFCLCFCMCMCLLLSVKNNSKAEQTIKISQRESINTSHQSNSDSFTNVIFDYIIIGSGISGCYVANQLVADFSHCQVLMITRDSDVGGVWKTTPWSWLQSDTPAITYSPDSKYSKFINSEYPTGVQGISGQHICSILSDQINNNRIRVQFNTEVISTSFTRSKNCWLVKTKNGNQFNSTMIINCTGLFQTPNFPDDVINKLKLHNIPFCHSSKFDDSKIKKDSKIAVIGSRESGLQVVSGLSRKQKVDWYARSFNNIYKSIDNFSWYVYLIRFLTANDITTRFCDEYIFWFAQHFYLFMIKHISTDIIKWMISDDTHLKHISFELKNNNKAETHVVLKPVFTNSSVQKSENITTYIIKDDNFEFIKNYDMVICATGYKYSEPFEIFVDTKKIDYDTFFLYRGISHFEAPNFFFCLPYSLMTPVSLRYTYRIIREMIEKERRITEFDYMEYKSKIEAFCLSINMTISQYKQASKSASFDNMLIS